jgi:hypothetical protein
LRCSAIGEAKAIRVREKGKVATYTLYALRFCKAEERERGSLFTIGCFRLVLASAAPSSA